MSKTPTPRTDNECIEIWTDPWQESTQPKDGPYVRSDFARQLERELAEVREQRDRMADALQQIIRIGSVMPDQSMEVEIATKALSPMKGDQPA